MARIVARLEKGTAVRISNDRHEWKADEPESLGGADTGPNPYELLLGSLAACTCITLALYCRHKGIRLQGVTATYDFGREHGRDCRDCDDAKTGFIERIRSRIRIEGDLDEAQKKRLTQIVSRCPVHKTLEHGVTLFEDVDFA